MKKRKEILLDSITIKLLEYQADQQGRNLKNYMEYILKQQAHSNHIQKNHQGTMEVMISRHMDGDTSYTSWEDVKPKI